MHPTYCCSRMQGCAHIKRARSSQTTGEAWDASWPHAGDRLVTAAVLRCRNGDEYRGSNWNILTVILALTFLIPVFGLLFAYLTYGTLWSSTGNYGNVYFY
jgi:hypothetical protein